ncbi:kinase-like domain-containing protein [Chaetomidium leptoderma]|uniref:Kinase-like domain-containing protein n=1 Tax=Chaetomidium leptoderma TaxID=669021 RepID=A0AAN6VWU9_9PEZI|nr:kinase-like domain-containing protein [Chaetomidium leptoderma]
MAVHSTKMDLALAAIHDADLPHPGGELLDCFIRQSVDREQAAAYLLQKCSSDRGKAGPAAFLADWTELILAFISEGVGRVHDRSIVCDITSRDGAKCCISGLDSSLADPLIVVRIFPESPQQLDPPLREMLDAFLSPSLKDVALTAETGNAPENLWLVRKSVAEAFSQGYFILRFQGSKDYRVDINRTGAPTQPPIVNEVRRLRRGSFTDHSGSGMAVPAHSALQVLGRFSQSIRWVLIGREIAQRTKHTSTKFAFPSSRFLASSCTAILTAIWRCVPAAFRVAIYRRLAPLGRYLYGPSCSLHVQRLPFGLYLKRKNLDWHQSLVNEYGALELVRHHTHVTAPRPLDLVSGADDSYLLTSAVSGYHIGLCIDIMSDAELADVARDLQASLVEIRSIPKIVAPTFEITNAVGGACYDHRISAGAVYDEARGDFFGPFENEDDFNNILRCGALPEVVHRGGHRVVFTHGDLNMRNIMVKDGKLSGIVDWENSGWYPEHWDYTKAHFITKRHWRWLRMVDKVSEELGSYEDELATERKLWEYCF